MRIAGSTVFGVADSDAALREQAAMVALLRLRPDGLSWAEIALAVADDGSSERVWREHTSTGLFSDPRIAEISADAKRDVVAWRSEGIGISTVVDDDYPRALRDVHQYPPILFTRGDLRPDDPAVSVVGSRRASSAGSIDAREVARGLCRRSMTVVAGLAEGIDTSAHQAALEIGGRTVAVVGTGIRRVYPPQNERLQSQIARHGAVISQFWPDAPPRRQTFPIRNAVMSGYGIATVIVEAGEHSGTRIQARLAVDHGRPVVLFERVVRSTSWGRDLVDRPGVHVATGVAEAMHAVDSVVDSNRGIAQLVSALVPPMA